MAFWLVRAGRLGEQENLALEKGLVVIGWDEMPDLSKIKSREEMRALCEEIYPDVSKNTISNYTGQTWGFKGRLEVGDVVALPLKTRSAVALGKITGAYEYRKDNPAGAKHCRTVQWIREDIPRSDFGQDILYSLGAFMTVGQIKRHDAEQRIAVMLEGKRDPLVGKKEPIGGEGESTEEEEALLDLEEYAQEQIRAYIGTKFKGHNLTRLVRDVLKAQGYQSYMSPAGPDGGIDILAGRGAMGFDAPRLCVQVKSGESPENVNTLRELQGVMKNFGAEQGLLVSWNGFKESVYKESRTLFFEIRLWDADRLVEAVLMEYDRLPEELQAELPLKRVWALVPRE